MTIHMQIYRGCIRSLALTQRYWQQVLQWYWNRMFWATEWHWVMFNDEYGICFKNGNHRNVSEGDSTDCRLMQLLNSVLLDNIIIVSRGITMDYRWPLLCSWSSMIAPRYMVEVLQLVAWPNNRRLQSVVFQQDNVRLSVANKPCKVSTSLFNQQNL